MSTATFTSTGAAAALAVAAHLGVLVVVCVAGGAALNTALRMVLAKRVLRPGHWFQVRRVGAEPIPTQVIELMTLWDWADVVLVRDPVDGSFAVTGTRTVLAVAGLGDDWSLPLPTVCNRVDSEEPVQSCEFLAVQSSPFHSESLLTQRSGDAQVQ